MQENVQDEVVVSREVAGAYEESFVHLRLVGAARSEEVGGRAQGDDNSQNKED